MKYVTNCSTHHCTPPPPQVSGNNKIIAQTNYKLNSIFLYFRLSMGNAKEDYVGNRKSQICLQMGYLHNHIR